MIIKDPSSPKSFPETSTAANLLIVFVLSCLHSVSQVVLIKNSLAGLLILAAIFFNSLWLGVAGSAGLLSSILTAAALGIKPEKIRAGLYGFNGLLVGLGAATFLGPDWSGQLFIVIIALSAFSVVLTETMTNLLSPWKIPPLTLPFNVTVLLFLVGVPGYENVPYTIVPESGPPGTGLVLEGTNIDAVFIFNAVFRGIGQLFLTNSPWSGMIITVGIYYAAPLLGAFALLGSLLGMASGLLLGADIDAIYNGLWGFNSYVAALAIGGVFLKPHLKSTLLAVSCAIVTALLWGAAEQFLSPWNLPPLTLPFCLGTIIFLLFKKDRHY